MMFKRIFKKKKTNESPVKQPENQPERRSYLDVWRALGKYTYTAGFNKEERLKKLFPRGPHNIKIVNRKTQQVATDSAIKPALYHNDLPDEMLPLFEHSFIGWQACSLLLQNPFIRKACEIPARDAISPDYTLHYQSGNEDKDGDPSTDEKTEAELLNKLKFISDKKMKIKDICRDANFFKKGFGQIIVCPTFNITMDMSKPYDPKKIKPQTYTGMTLIQPFWATYELSENGVASPDQSGYYEPEYYVVNGNKRIHKSWVRKLVNGALPDILKPVYYWGGVPLPQQIYERVFCAEKTANEAPKLALTKRLLIIDGNVENLIANPQTVYETLRGIGDLRDNMGFMVKRPGDQVSQIDTSLADMDALIMTQYQLGAAIAEMPVTKFMKTQLKGLGNTGTYEIKDYNQSLVEIQKNDFDTILDWHYELLTLSETGRQLYLNINWNPIDTPTESEVADIELKESQIDSQYIAAGVIDASEVRATLRDNEKSRYHNLEPDLPEPDFDLEE